MATAKHFTALAGVEVAMDEGELVLALDHLESAKTGAKISPWASDELLDAIKRFIGDA